MSKQPISVLDKQKLLMRQAGDLLKKLENVTVMFAGKPEYQLERQVDIANQYNQVMNQLKALIVPATVTGEPLLGKLKSKI